ncbi:MAG: penicillin-binding transpeptidase domain-containing protein [Firmicutes bacterium]|nr:penicillin-binding transpeptidase domain-containing protein [Bacillota bacterium]
MTEIAVSRRPASSVVVRRRIYFIFFLVGFAFSSLVLRLAWVQIVQNSAFRRLALEQRMRPVPVDPKRGTIYDRKRRELAVSMSADSIYAIPAEISDPVRTARSLAPVLGMSEEALLRLVTQRQQTVWLKRKVGPEVARAVRDLGLPGIGVSESGQRFYPKDTLAAQVLGIAGTDNQGLEGLEKFYDTYLRGVRGQVVAERDATGKEIPEGRHSYVPPSDGMSIVLTIDEVIQYICERELDRAMQDTGSVRGLVLAMDPRNGEVLAMAMRPAFNPNSYNDYPAQFRRNFAVCDIYEPGSTFKVVTAAAAMEEGIVSSTSQFYDPGYLKVEDRILNCWKPGGHGSQTFIEATENSCNPVFATLALRLGTDKFLQYMRAFGIGEKSGIDFPGEATGLMHQPKSIGPVELATYGYGQGVSVTPLQLLNALCAVANGGVLMKPMLVREVIDLKGATVARFSPTRIRQVISERTSRELVNILQSVVVNGSGTRAAVPGYAVAGKTGTAQKPEAGRYGDKRIASFMGFAPANDPRIAVLVVLDEPSVPVKFGGVIAAPVFQAVVEDSLRYMEIPPTYALGSVAPPEPAQVTVPNVTGMTGDEAAAIMYSARLGMRAEGTGPIVTNQVPKAGSQVNAGTTVIVYFGHEELYNLESIEVEVPDVTGKTLKEAALVLGARGLGVAPKGSGIVRSQDPPAGTRVRKGTAITIFLKD